MVKWQKKSVLPFFAIAFVSLFLVLPQIYNYGLILGNDWPFHSNRFYECYMQIRTGRFNWFQSLYSFDQSGRIVNAVYGGDLAYLFGLILVVLKSWFRFQVFTAWLSFVVAGMGMFVLAKSAKLKQRDSLIAAVLYMGTPVVASYALSTGFSSWGVAILPYIFVPFVRVLTSKVRPNWLWLGCSVSLLIGTHLLSTLFGLSVLFLLFIVCLTASQEPWHLVQDVLKSVALALVLSGANLVGFVQTYFGNQLLSPWINHNMSNSTMRLGLGASSWSQYGLIYTVLLLFEIALVLTKWNSSSELEKLSVTVGGVYLLLSSNIVPWTILSRYLPIVTMIQFPQRLSVIAYIFLILGLMISLSQDMPANENIGLSKYSFLILCALMSTFQVYSQINSGSFFWQTSDPAGGGNNSWVIKKTPSGLRTAFGSNDLENALDAVNKPTPDYLPKRSQNPNGYHLYQTEVIDQAKRYRVSVTRDNKLRLQWKSYTSESQILPVIVYHRSIVDINGEHRPHVDTSEIGALKVKARKGLNTVTVGYDTGKVFRVLIAAKILGILSVLILIMYLTWERLRGMRLPKRVADFFNINY